MKKLLAVISGTVLCSLSMADQGDFTVRTIGASNNTNTIFVETSEDANTSCSNKKLFRLMDTDKNADRFFSLALAAQAQGKKITIDYTSGNCFDNGTIVNVFRIKK